jgi:hypothetical protein
MRVVSGESNSGARGHDTGIGGHGAGLGCVWRMHGVWDMSLALFQTQA